MGYKGSRSFLGKYEDETDLTTEKEVNSDSSVEEEVQLVQARGDMAV